MYCSSMLGIDQLSSFSPDCISAGFLSVYFWAIIIRKFLDGFILFHNIFFFFERMWSNPVPSIVLVHFGDLFFIYFLFLLLDGQKCMHDLFWLLRFSLQLVCNNSMWLFFFLSKCLGMRTMFAQRGITQTPPPKNESNIFVVENSLRSLHPLLPRRTSMLAHTQNQWQFNCRIYLRICAPYTHWERDTPNTPIPLQQIFRS